MSAAGCPDVWSGHIDHVLYDTEKLQARVRELAATVSSDYPEGSEIVVVALLNGAVCFAVDLVRNLNISYTMDFMAVSSYKGTQSGNVELKKDLSFNPAGKHILVVEDIIDTGSTLRWLHEHLKSKGCASVKICCLLDKKEGRTTENSEMMVDYVGFVCPNRFVVGYGLDFNQKYRGLPFIGVLKPEVYGEGE